MANKPAHWANKAGRQFVSQILTLAGFSLKEETSYTESVTVMVC